MEIIILKRQIVKYLTTIVVVINLGANASAQTFDTSIRIPEKVRTSKQVVKGFMNMRFGMFVHWGPVSLRGTEIGWSRNLQVSQSDYDSLYKEFNPVLFNADDIIRTAKDAGMKYFVIVTKHHDGFCLWPSAYTDYDIASTPYKKDILKQFAEACKKYNVKLCFYYSVLDWHYPDYPVHNPYKKEEDTNADMNKYLSYMKNQLKELVTNYHPYLLWFDGGWEKPWTQHMAYDTYLYLKSLDKNLLINNRLDKGMISLEASKSILRIGDFDTPEQRIGIMDMNMPSESNITIAKQWAWKPNDSVKSLKTCIQTLSKTTGSNGNLLFNVGPMPDGRIEARQVELLKAIGDWIHKNSEAIYGTLGGPYKPNEKYASTRKGNKIFVHIFSNKVGELVLPAIEDCKVVNAYWLKGGAVGLNQTDNEIRLLLPAVLPDKNCSVLVLEMNKNMEAVPVIELNKL